jgi:hypothetical protein
LGGAYDDISDNGTALPSEALFVASLIDTLSIQPSTLKSTPFASADNKHMDWKQKDVTVETPRAIEATKAVVEINTPFEVEPLTTLGGVGQRSAQTLPSK